MRSGGDYEEAQGLGVGALIRGLLHGISSSEQVKSPQRRLRFMSRHTPQMSSYCFSKEA